MSENHAKSKRVWRQ